LALRCASRQSIAASNAPRLLIDEMKAAVGQLGAASLKALGSLKIRHEGAIDFEPLSGR
jgi:hypothetical protein